MEITKDDLIQLIKDTVASMNEAPVEDKAEMKEVEEVKEEKASDDTTDTCDTCEVEEKKEERSCECLRQSKSCQE